MRFDLAVPSAAGAVLLTTAQKAEMFARFDLVVPSAAKSVELPTAQKVEIFGRFDRANPLAAVSVKPPTAQTAKIFAVGGFTDTASHRVCRERLVRVERDGSQGGCRPLCD